MTIRKVSENYVVKRFNPGHKDIKILMTIDFETYPNEPTVTFENPYGGKEFKFIQSDPKLAAKVIQAMSEAIKLAEKVIANERKSNTTGKAKKNTGKKAR